MRRPQAETPETPLRSPLQPIGPDKERRLQRACAVIRCHTRLAARAARKSASAPLPFRSILQAALATHACLRLVPVTAHKCKRGAVRRPRPLRKPAAGDPRRNSYLRIDATTPAPTVRPPSRMAKRRPSSIAIGTISSTSTDTLSPGITISVPSGRLTTPVTSVVRK